MNVASLELCKELYKLSGWGKERAGLEVAFSYMGSGGDYSVVHTLAVQGGGYFEHFPAYDLGYLLRELPINLKDDPEFTYWLELSPMDERTWGAMYSCEDLERYFNFANNPEDALCKLAIELFKQGVLK